MKYSGLYKGGVSYTCSHMCVRRRYRYFSSSLIALHFTYWQGLSLNPKHTDLVNLDHQLALGINCLYLLIARITDRSPNPNRFLWVLRIQSPVLMFV